MNVPKVSIIILNWNGWKDTLECLESIYQIDYLNYDVVLVDNASKDESLNKIKKYCENNLKFKSKILNSKPKSSIKTLESTENFIENKHGMILIKNQENYGFAKGNNIGMDYVLKYLNPDYILLLNNDTIVDKDFLKNMVKVAETNEKIGIVGPKLLNANNPKIIDSTGHIIRWGRVVDRGHGKIDNKQYDNKNEVIGAMAAASLYRTDMLRDIGLLNESYVTLYEDAELSWRAKIKGWNAKYAPNSIVYHKREKSIDKKSSFPKIELNTKNTIKTVESYGSKYQKFLFAFILMKEAFQVVGSRFMNKNNVKIDKYLKLVLSYYKNILNI